MKKTVQVIMLPTNNRNKTLLLRKDGFLTITDIEETRETMGGNYDLYTPQHLYFTSNEEIKEGDWFIYRENLGTHISKTTNAKHADELNELIARGYKRLKVIATTDKSLNLPLIPQSFIEEYVKSNGEIKEVIINYIPAVKHSVVVNKKQTVEEAAEEYKKYSYAGNIDISLRLQEAFIAGAKWKENNS